MKIINSELLLKGHPDKLADQIADHIVMEYLKEDPNSKVNIDVVGGEGLLLITGKIYSPVKLNYKELAFSLLGKLGQHTDLVFVDNVDNKDLSEYNNSMETREAKVCGYVCNETREFLPKSVIILRDFYNTYSNLYENNVNYYLDGKVSITGLYDDNDRLLKLNSVNIDYQHPLSADTNVADYILKKLFSETANKYNVEVGMFTVNSGNRNPNGKVGFDRQTGLTGRPKDINNCNIFSMINKDMFCGKDPNGLPRLALLKANKIAKDLLIKHNLHWCEVNLEINNDKITIDVNSNKGNIYVGNEVYNNCIIDNSGLQSLLGLQ